jgi:Winged helix DNA-binding domain
MMESVTATSAEQAYRLWNWVLSRQGLGPDRRLPDVRTVADRSLGLHAARLSSPFATAVARTCEDADLSQLLGPRPHPHLVTVRCMRKTLHVLPLHAAGTALAATRHYRLRDVGRSVWNARLDPARFREAQRWLLLELSSGSRSHRELERSATRLGWSIPEARLALKWCWEAGLVVYRNISDSWHRENRSFSLVSNSHPELAAELDAESSIDELVRLYFERYGPATLQDASWWSGLGRQRILAALKRTDMVKLELPWAKSPFFMFAEDFLAFVGAANESDPVGLNFLAHEDVALKAYHESRCRYLGHVTARSVFNQIGEVLPTILWNGQVIGSWSWDHSRRQVTYGHFSSVAKPRDVRSTSRRMARVLRERLLKGYVA